MYFFALNQKEKLKVSLAGLALGIRLVLI